jgi:hypothetical protein
MHFYLDFIYYGNIFICCRCGHFNIRLFNIKEREKENNMSLFKRCFNQKGFWKFEPETSRWINTASAGHSVNSLIEDVEFYEATDWQDMPTGKATLIGAAQVPVSKVMEALTTDAVPVARETALKHLGLTLD